MIQLQMRILVGVEPIDFRKGIDGLARACREVLAADPFSGWLFVFRNRRATAMPLTRTRVVPRGASSSMTHSLT